MLNIVLHQLEIPFNTGAIGRTCVATGSALHLIYPLGFIINDIYIRVTQSLAEWCSSVSSGPGYLSSL